MPPGAGAGVQRLVLQPPRAERGPGEDDPGAGSLGHLAASFPGLRHLVLHSAALTGPGARQLRPLGGLVELKLMWCVAGKPCWRPQACLEHAGPGWAFAMPDARPVLAPTNTTATPWQVAAGGRHGAAGAVPLAGAASAGSLPVPRHLLPGGGPGRCPGRPAAQPRGGGHPSGPRRLAARQARPDPAGLPHLHRRQLRAGMEPVSAAAWVPRRMAPFGLFWTPLPRALTAHHFLAARSGCMCHTALPLLHPAFHH